MEGFFVITLQTWMDLNETWNTSEGPQCTHQKIGAKTCFCDQSSTWPFGHLSCACLDHFWNIRRIVVHGCTPMKNLSNFCTGGQVQRTAKRGNFEEGVCCPNLCRLSCTLITGIIQHPKGPRPWPLYVSFGGIGRTVWALRAPKNQFWHSVPLSGCR